MKKKIGTVMEETLLFGAKKAALEKRIPFSRFIELAVEESLRKQKNERIDREEASTGRRPPDEIRPDPAIHIPEVREKRIDYVLREGGTSRAAGALSDSKANFSVNPEERRRRAVALAGKYRSGRPDIAERHDEYAYDVSGNAPKSEE
jgi:hypothetical protein